MPNIFNSEIVTCFADVTVGTKVNSEIDFKNNLLKRLETYSFPASGQGFVPFDEYLQRAFLTLPAVIAGVARRKNVPVDGYHVKEYRGEIGFFAKRQYAEKPEHLNVVIYTADAYCTDPQVTEAERERLGLEGLCKEDYVLVAVLATVGPKPPVSSHRFVRNLAGGNNAYSPEEGYTLEKAIAECKAVVEYEQEWATVSD